MAKSSKEGTHFSPLSYCPVVPGDTVQGRVRDGRGMFHMLTTVKEAKSQQS